MAAINTNLGRIGTVHKGTYSASAQYQFLDTVIYKGSLWKNTATGATPVGTSPDNSAYWELYLPGMHYVVVGPSDPEPTLVEGLFVFRVEA